MQNIELSLLGDQMKSLREIAGLEKEYIREFIEKFHPAYGEYYERFENGEPLEKDADICNNYAFKNIVFNTLVSLCNVNGISFKKVVGEYCEKNDLDAESFMEHNIVAAINSVFNILGIDNEYLYNNVIELNEMSVEATHRIIELTESYNGLLETSKKVSDGLGVSCDRLQKKYQSTFNDYSEVRDKYEMLTEVIGSNDDLSKVVLEAISTFRKKDKEENTLEMMFYDETYDDVVTRIGQVQKFYEEDTEEVSQ